MGFRTPLTPTFITGDATRPHGSRDRVKIIVHICNDVGAWGKGFVMALSRKWPHVKGQYSRWYNGNTNLKPMALGRVQFVRATPTTIVANMIAQNDIVSVHGRPPIRYSAVRTCLQQVATLAKQLNATVHMPRMGAGLAGGSWPKVYAIVQETLSQQGVPTFVYTLPVVAKTKNNKTNDSKKTLFNRSAQPKFGEYNTSKSMRTSVKNRKYATA